MKPICMGKCIDVLKEELFYYYFFNLPLGRVKMTKSSCLEVDFLIPDVCVTFTIMLLS